MPKKITEFEKKYCVFCGEEIPRAYWAGTGRHRFESIASYNRRKWCKQKCPAPKPERKVYEYLRFKNKRDGLGKFVKRIKTK